MRKGITGAKENLDPNLEKNLQSIKQFLNCPIAVGWGISTPEHIRNLPGEADIAII
jgi:tryptophan synthase alpha subunit